MQENESNESDKPTQDEQIREYGQVVLKANAGKHRIFLLSIIGEVEGHEQSPGNVKTTSTNTFSHNWPWQKTAATSTASLFF